MKKDNWIWLPEKIYPENQITTYSGFNSYENGNYTVCEFLKKYSFGKIAKRVFLRFSGDTEFLLYINGGLVASGPAFSGGDYNLGNDKPRPNFYAFETEVCVDDCELEFFTRVKMMPVKLCEYSKGHGGFMLSGIVTFSDGTVEEISTDSTWLVRKNGAYTGPYSYDNRILPDEYVAAEEIRDIWQVKAAPIPIRCEEEIFPINNRTIALLPEEKKEVVAEFDKIYSGFLHVTASGAGIVNIEITPRELEEGGFVENIVFDGDGEYRGFAMHSAGNFLMKLENTSDFPTEVAASFIFTHYPISEEAKIETSDKELEAVLDTCRHTLKICRQTMHLDSPRHCEPLACTGDYYIETLMTAFSFGDMRLAKFDIIRTAELLRHNDGRMFHTTYSLIWVRMLYDVYMFTGDKSLICDCTDALDKLLARFESYIGDNGLIETPPDYMFVDWLYIDGLSMHHPPKALGQTCLNIFYYGALDVAAKIYAKLSQADKKADCEQKAKVLKSAVNALLFDAEKGMYFEGLNTKTPEELLGDFMPQNVEKRYYLKHSNILAAYTGICGEELGRELVHKIMSDECPGDYQPYFAHYLLEAIYKNGLRDEYTLTVLEKWKKPVAECPKGLVEGFLPPEPAYAFDHSHAWGGTPLWSLPRALTGLEINKPGMSEITLNPSLLGLENASVELLTPHGSVVCKMEKGEEIFVSHPDCVKVNIAKNDC